MTFKEYQKEAVFYRVGTANNKEYLTLGLIEEVGEAAGKLAKHIRDGVFDEKAFIKELGDILWFVANLVDYCEWESDASFTSEISKLNACFKTDFWDCCSPAWRLIYMAHYIGNTVTCKSCCFAYIVEEVNRLAHYFGYTLEQVAEINLAKLRDRQARGQIHGNGDER